MGARPRLKNFDAVIFDLDGVITDSASIHAIAWKALFDDYLYQRAKKSGQEYVPFDLDHDYRKYVDGKPRYDGVQSFLESRSVRLARGTAQDAARRETICGLGNRKDKLFTQMLRRDGVKLFGPTIRLILRLHGQGVRCGVASSSKNCRLILRTAGIEAMFQARVDGVVSDQLGLKGKPAPDIFLHCATMLRVPPNRAVVVEGRDLRCPSRPARRICTGHGAWAKESSRYPGSARC